MVNPEIWHPRMPYYAELISNKTGGVARDIWGFIDGTIRKTTRPIYHQQTVYTRFKKCHGLKFQSVFVPDGFIAFLFGPVPGKHMIPDCYEKVNYYNSCNKSCHQLLPLQSIHFMEI